MTSSASGASSSSSSSVSSPSPAALDHYDIDFGANGELGSGSFATVRRGVDRRNGRTVAVKLCRIERMEQLDLEALEVEVDVLQRLKHPHIMDLYDYAVDDEYHYLFTEYLPGGELFDRIIEVARTGIPILMVEQNARQALEIADKGYVLVQGANAFTGTGKELLADPEVRKSFLGG